MSLGWFNNKSPSHTLLCYISTPNYWALTYIFFAVFISLTLDQIPFLLGMFPSRTPLREPFTSPACPGLVSWPLVVRAQSPGSSSHQRSHTSGSAYPAVLARITFASLFTFLSPHLRAPLQSLPLQTDIQGLPSQAFSLHLPISAGGCSSQPLTLLPVVGDINCSSFPRHLENILRSSRFKWLLDYTPRPIF